MVCLRVIAYGCALVEVAEQRCQGARDRRGHERPGEQLIVNVAFELAVTMTVHAVRLALCAACCPSRADSYRTVSMVMLVDLLQLNWVPAILGHIRKLPNKLIYGDVQSLCAALLSANPS